MEMPQARAAGAQPQEISVTPPSSNVRVGWLMPPFFHDLPVDAPDADSAAESLYNIATSVLAEQSSDDQYAFALLLAAQLEPMAESNVISAGMCFLEVEGQPTASTVQVAQLPHDSEDSEIVSTLLETLRGAYTRDEVNEAALPCGPAVTRIGSSPFAVENTATGDIQTVQRNIIQAYVPLPGTSELLLFELGVFSAEGWELHSEVFAEILKSIDWATDDEVREARALARPEAQHGVGDGLDEAVKGDLRALSSQLAELCALDPDETLANARLSGTTCRDCWSKGLRSACQARHEWQVSGASAEKVGAALLLVAERFTELGWQTETLHAQQRLVLQTDTRSLKVSPVPEAGGSLRVEMASSCTRIANDSVADDFG